MSETLRSVYYAWELPENLKRDTRWDLSSACVGELQLFDTIEDAEAAAKEFMEDNETDEAVVFEVKPIHRVVRVRGVERKPL